MKYLLSLLKRSQKLLCIEIQIVAIKCFMSFIVILRKVAKCNLQFMTTILTRKT
jgi:hypothetical protein